MTFEVEREVMKRQPDYPPTQSEWGSNAYAMMCDHVGYRTGYCVCLNKIKAYGVDRTRLSPYPVCDKHITSKTCPAIDMQAQENAAGKALFFVDRIKLREAMDAHFAEISAARKSDFYTAPTPSKKKSVIVTGKQSAVTKPIEKVTDNLLQSTSEENGFAAAINAAIQELPKEEAKVVILPAKPQVEKKTLSMLDMARLKFAKSNEKDKS